MAETRRPVGVSHEPATQDEIKSILGALDETRVLAIIELRPTIADVERALMWLGGDTDIFGADQPLKGVAAQIVSILTADENENDGPPSVH